MQLSLRTLLIIAALMAVYVALVRRFEWIMLGPVIVFGPVIFFHFLLFRASHISRLRWPWRLSLAWLESTLLLAVVAGLIGMGVDAVVFPSRVPIAVERVSYARQFFRAYGLYSFVVSGACAAMTAIPVLVKWPLFRHVLSRLSEDALLVVLLLALGPLLWMMPEHARLLPALVEWQTIAALAGLMVLSRALEESGYLAYAGRWLLERIHGERTLAVVLVLFSAALSSVITNDVALFIVVPLTISLRRVADLPIGRLAVFEALAVNAGSAVSPVGNPQNLFLWQTSRATFVEFIAAMLPLASCLLLLLIGLIPLGFPQRRIGLATAGECAPLQRRMLWMSLALYPIFLVLTDQGWAVEAVGAIVASYLLWFRRVLFGVDWLLLVVFILMFVDLGLLARLPATGAISGELRSLPGGMFTAGVLLSQLMSNVPAAIFLEGFSDDWRLLAWGVSVGGFGLAIGSLANLIALRLARQPRLWGDFHLWSLPMLVGGCAIAAALSLVAELPR